MDELPIMIKIDPKNINFFNQIMEGHEYLGVVSTLNRGEGILVIRATPDTEPEVKKILANLPMNFEYLQ